MEDLLDQETQGSFPITKVLDNMCERHIQPILWDRLHKKEESHVNIARLDMSCAQAKQEEFKKRPPEKACLKLRFSLTEPDLTPEQVIKLGHTLPNVFEAADISLCGINWLEMEANIDPSSPIARWRTATALATEIRQRSLSVLSIASSTGEISPTEMHLRSNSASSSAAASSSRLTVETHNELRTDEDAVESPCTSQGSESITDCDSDAIDPPE